MSTNKFAVERIELDGSDVTGITAASLTAAGLAYLLGRLQPPGRDCRIVVQTETGDHEIAALEREPISGDLIVLVTRPEPAPERDDEA